MKEKILEEVKQSRETCEISVAGSQKCSAACDAVEELQAEASHQKQDKPKNSLEIYCDDNPDAVECRLYED
ncbi:MAG: Calvin cycle protein CP12 [Pseudanabaena sp.]